MQDYSYFDCFVEIGRYTPKDPAQPWTVEDLLEDMQRCHIDAALVYTHHAKEVDPQRGNDLTLEYCRQQTCLYPCWIALPHHATDFPPPEQLLEQMEQNQVRALKLFPRQFKFQVDRDTVGPLLSRIESAGLLLLIDAGVHGAFCQISWQELAWIGEHFPRCNVLLQSIRWESTRQLLPLLKRYKNFYIEFSGYQGNRMVEFWCQEIGAERLLFGSQAVQKSMGAARAYIDYAEISESQRRAIAGENLNRLLGVEKFKILNKEPVKDKIIRRALQGRAPGDFTVIDSHAHILREGGMSAGQVVMNCGDAKAVIERNMRIGAHVTCVSSWSAIWGDYERGNQEVHRAMERFPENIVGYAVLNPGYIKDWNKACHYYYGELGFKGLKPYFPKWQIPYNDPLLRPWYEYAEQWSLFCLLHPSDNFKSEVRDLAAAFPNLTFILAHTGADWATARTHVELAKEFKNIYLEITQTNVMNGILEFMAEEVTSHRILYGSDTPMRDPYPQFGWVAYCKLSETAKRQILCDNMQKILNQAHKVG